MPTELPSHPSLEYLKKQAKALLRDFRQSEPGAIEKFAALRLQAPPKLSDAQHLVAREYGFDTWAELKERAESLAGQSDDPIELVKKAYRDDDTKAMRSLLKRYPELRTKLNEPIDGFDSPAITHVQSPAMLDVLLNAGADINAKSRWWAGGFGLLDCASPDLAAYAIKRGAEVTIHAAARLGMLDRLKQLLAADPALVHTRGGDGQMPLHFASTVPIAEYLLDHGADIEARDIDHESTAVQYMVRSRPEVARYLIRRGCKTDILMAAALGDADLVRKHLEADSESIRMRVSNDYFPMVGPHSGGTIYQWELGWYVSAVQVANKFDHPDIFRTLMESCPDDEKLLNACWLHDEQMVDSLLARNPALAMSLPAAGRRHLAHAARNNDVSAARLMLKAGFPIDAVGQHRATALHWAAWHGRAEIVRLILHRGPQLENTENEYKSTPLGWAIHGSQNGWQRKEGDYPAAVEALLLAGAKPPESLDGSEGVRDVLRKHGVA